MLSKGIQNYSYDLQYVSFLKYCSKVFFSPKEINTF